VYWTKRHVLVCTASHCAQKGANEVVGKLRLDIVRRGLDAEILVNNCGTIDLCDIGPNIVVYPDNVILSGVTTRDLPDVIAYLNGGAVPERLVTAPTSGTESKRRAFYADYVARAEPLPSSEFAALASAAGFETGWVDEQVKRGFVARKPAAGGDQVLVTKKARDRYRLGRT
jgi:(2Fe-2S) ferredoxin